MPVTLHQDSPEIPHRQKTPPQHTRILLASWSVTCGHWYTATFLGSLFYSEASLWIYNHVVLHFSFKLFFRITDFPSYFLPLDFSLNHFQFLSNEELTHWERPWCWKRLRAREEEGNRGWNDWMASPTQWTWTWASSGRWWRTGMPSVLQFMGLQRVWHDWVTEQQPPG